MKVEKFKSMMVAESWDRMRHDSPSIAAEELNKILTEMLDECFPWKEFYIKSTDPPWMNGDVRRCSKRKRRKFREQGRGPEYRVLQKLMDKLVAKAKSVFFAGVKEDMLIKGDIKGYHKAVKQFTTKDAPTRWDIRQLLVECRYIRTNNRSALVLQRKKLILRT